jgi:signal transduction histidine kinase
MPRGLPGLPAWAWFAIAVAVVTAVVAGRVLHDRPLVALSMLTVASVTVCAAAAQSYSPTVQTNWFLIAGQVALGYVVATRPPWSWAAAFALLLVFLPAEAWLRRGIGETVGFGYTTIDGRWTYWLTFAVMPAIVAGLIGYSVRQARSYARRLSEQVAGQAVVAERLRISRELHDQVAHSVGIITLQAGAAVRVLDAQPEEARVAMRAVEATGRETLSGLRRMLSALRDDGPAPLQPVLGLADVERLAAATTAAGVRVDLQWLGSPRIVPPEVDLSAYRIIQESLTNVLRHAKTDRCEVAVDYLPEELSIEVTNAAATPLGPGLARGKGYGLIGLRERVTLLSGSFSAGVRPEGGFRVAARIPVPARGAS